jgi:hypothetical protein
MDAVWPSRNRHQTGRMVMIDSICHMVLGDEDVVPVCVAMWKMELFQAY